ncbi:MAG: hypothetical protein CM1200mP3_09010 [Chloroflexota bacterium]|nr:MAG: hypothetical protein CM1200mP3_09010 [Chloroflexota bacterium]
MLDICTEGLKKSLRVSVTIRLKPLFDRLDYVGNLNNELAFCLAVEKLMGITVPKRGGIQKG